MKTIALALALAAPAAASYSEFGAVRALLETRCLSCHHPDKTKGGLLMTTRDALLKGGDGGTALVPGKAAESPLHQRLSLDPDDIDIMPPVGDTLSAGEAALVARWIDAAAP